MVVINIGMPRSGTLWRYNLIKALVLASGGQDALALREQFHLQPFIGEENALMKTLKAKRLAPALLPAFFGKSYVLNSHARPFVFARTLVRSGMVKAIYGYRDPRDCILSMLEYSQRRKAHYSARFLDLHDVKDSIHFMSLYMQAWEDWTTTENALIVRYEDMHVDFDRVLTQIITYLDLKFESEQVEEVRASYLPRQKPTSGEHIHLETGLPNRFRSAFTNEELAELTQAFAPYLEKMGYPV